MDLSCKYYIALKYFVLFLPSPIDLIFFSSRAQAGGRVYLIQMIWRPFPFILASFHSFFGNDFRLIQWFRHLDIWIPRIMSGRGLLTVAMALLWWCHAHVTVAMVLLWWCHAHVEFFFRNFFRNFFSIFFSKFFFNFFFEIFFQFFFRIFFSIFFSKFFFDLLRWHFFSLVGHKNSRDDSHTYYY